MVDNLKPILFEDTATDFGTLGLGVMAEATSCIITEERNGAYELEMKYPVSGRLFPKIKNRAIIVSSVRQTGRKEPFRIYRIAKPMNGIVTIYAAHLSYDLSGVTLSRFSASNAPDAMSKIKENSVNDNPFSFWTDLTTTANFSVSVPSTVRSIMGGKAGSLLDVYGGEYAYNGYAVRLYKQRGTDRGVTLRYGKNLTDLKQEENIQNVYTGVYAYWVSDDSYVELPEKIVNAPGEYGFTKIKPLDCSSQFDDAPSEDQIRSYAERYVKDNNIGVPNVSIDVEFAPLEQSEEYASLAQLQRVELCDTVTVRFDRLGVNASAKCVKTVFDVLKNRYQSISLGDARTNIADTIATQQKEIRKVQSPSFLQQAALSATQLITGNKGGYVVLHSSTGGKTPDEILIMDQPTIETAASVWRWNAAGLGYSKNGYSGPFDLAMTMDGQIVADFIATGTLNAAQIEVLNLIADHVLSKSGEASIEISGAAVTMKFGENITLQLNNSADGLPIMYFAGIYDGTTERAEITPQQIKIGGSSVTPAILLNGGSGSDANYSLLSGNGSVKANTIAGANVHGDRFNLGSQTFAVLSDSRRWINTDYFQVSGLGNCEWEYNATLRKTILVQK